MNGRQAGKALRLGAATLLALAATYTAVAIVRATVLELEGRRHGHHFLGGVIVLLIIGLLAGWGSAQVWRGGKGTRS